MSIHALLKNLTPASTDLLRWAVLGLVWLGALVGELRFDHVADPVVGRASAIQTFHGPERQFGGTPNAVGLIFAHPSDNRLQQLTAVDQPESADNASLAAVMLAMIGIGLLGIRLANLGNLFRRDCPIGRIKPT